MLWQNLMSIMKINTVDKEHPHLCGCSNGRKMLHTYSLLPVAVMGLNINPLTIDHPKVTSYKIRFTWSIIAILAKALFSAAININFDFNHYIKPLN